VGKKEKLKRKKTDMLRSTGKQCGDCVESVVKNGAEIYPVASYGSWHANI